MIGCNCPVCKSADLKDKRLRSSILIQSKTTNIVVDSGPDFRCQMLRTNTQKLDAIIFTHPHKDHVAGLDDVRGFNYFMQKPMDIFGNEMTLEVIMREFPYAFAEKKYPGAPDITLNTLTDKTFQIGDLTIIPVPVWHLHMPVLGFRFGKFTYITDANRIDDKSLELIRGSKVLVLNALRKEKHISHFSLEEAIDLARKLDIPSTYLTHISHQLGKHEDVSKELPEGVYLAYDGLTLSF